MKLYCMSFNVNLNGKNYSATLPRRFEKREWLAKYKEYLVKLAYEILFNANGEFVTDNNYLKYINKIALPYLSTDELDFILMYYTREYFRLRKYKNFNMTIGLSIVVI
jgi:hypothetical protein